MSGENSRAKEEKSCHKVVGASLGVLVIIHCVSKNVPPSTCYNLYIHGSIATILAQMLPRK